MGSSDDDNGRAKDICHQEPISRGGKRRARLYLDTTSGLVVRQENHTNTCLRETLQLLERELPGHEAKVFAEMAEELMDQEWEELINVSIPLCKARKDVHDEAEKI